MMMTEPVAIRRAGPQDVPGCAKVVNDWIDATDWMARAYEPEVIEGFIRDAFDKREIWISGEPVDAYLSFNPQTSQIGALYCRKTGRGVGKALIDRARQGRDFVWLNTHEPNVRAQKFYAREQFVETGRFDPVPPETVREIRMEWHR